MAIGGVTKKKNVKKDQDDVYTMDGTVDYLGHPASRQDTGRWSAGNIILGKNITTSLFFIVGTHFIYILTLVMHYKI
ncbi:Protein NRT1/ PTR FAMILY 7.3 [Bienertia sinuspersici]